MKTECTVCDGSGRVPADEWCPEVECEPCAGTGFALCRCGRIADAHNGYGPGLRARPSVRCRACADDARVSAYEDARGE